MIILIFKELILLAFVLCFTGISGSGKTTLANKIFEYYTNNNVPIEMIDGDILRNELSNLFGYTYEERMKQNLVVRILAKYLLKHEINIIISIVAPYHKMRDEMRSFFGDSYIQCYLNCNQLVCEKRDVKGYYAMARQGRLKHLNGTNDSYEIPTNSDIVIDTSNKSIDECVKEILTYLEVKGYGISVHYK